jgi:hypothetical protein
MQRLLALILPLALGATMATAAHAGRLAVGDTLPALTGERLSGDALHLPEAAHGKVALLAMGFSYASRHAVEAWVTRFRSEFGRDSAVTFYELPMMSGFGARMGKPFIDSGMRRGTPRELHPQVATVWKDVGAWKQRIGVAHSDLAYLLVLDRDGCVAWVGDGGTDLAGYEALAKQVRGQITR